MKPMQCDRKTCNLFIKIVADWEGDNYSKQFKI